MRKKLYAQQKLEKKGKWVEAYKLSLMKALITYDLEKMGWRKFISHDQVEYSKDNDWKNGFDLSSDFDLN